MISQFRKIVNVKAFIARRKCRMQRLCRHNLNFLEKSYGRSKFGWKSNVTEIRHIVRDEIERSRNIGYLPW